ASFPRRCERGAFPFPAGRAAPSAALSAARGRSRTFCVRSRSCSPPPCADRRSAGRQPPHGGTAVLWAAGGGVPPHTRAMRQWALVFALLLGLAGSGYVAAARLRLPIPIERRLGSWLLDGRLHRTLDWWRA